MSLAFNAVDYVPWVMERLESFFIINVYGETLLCFFFNFNFVFCHWKILFVQILEENYKVLEIYYVIQ